MCFHMGESSPSFERFFLVIAISTFVGPAMAFAVAKRYLVRVIFSVLSIIIFIGFFGIGERSFYLAYNSCIEKGEQVRVALNKYQKSNLEYPDNLNLLEIDIPCSRILSGTLMQYEKTESGYILSFSDWLVIHRANQDETFNAIK